MHRFRLTAFSRLSFSAFADIYHIHTAHVVRSASSSAFLPFTPFDTHGRHCVSVPSMQHLFPNPEQDLFSQPDLAAFEERSPRLFFA